MTRRPRGIPTPRATARPAETSGCFFWSSSSLCSESSSSWSSSSVECSDSPATPGTTVPRAIVNGPSPNSQESSSSSSIVTPPQQNSGSSVSNPKFTIGIPPSRS
ncbi:hypothetical protein BDW59DRAFT_145169 [Aspergillus cavernicola]|uniref:REJ domain-containing protein n=1 Tax=Aspergillus cavernicola TaxID=176166 RepID=A0ABR4IFD0_9EURO